MKALLLCMDRITIRVRGERSRRIRSASRPLNPGIIRSRTRTSGFNRSVRRTVSRPSAATPTIEKSRSRLQKGLHPPANYRMIVRQDNGNGHSHLLKRITCRSRRSFIERQFGGDGRSGPRRRLDESRGRPTSIMRSCIPMRPLELWRFQGGFRIEAATAVFNLQVQHVGVGPDAHGYNCHTSVARGIG